MAVVCFLYRRRLSQALRTFLRVLGRSLRHEWSAERRRLCDIGCYQRVALLLLLVMGLCLRALFMDVPLRHDEAATYVFYAQKPLPITVSLYTLPNNHLFHSALVNISTRIFGPDPWAIRLPALLAGVLLSALAAWLGLQFFGAAEGLLAAAFVVASSAWVEYSVNARGYTLIGCFFLLSLIAVNRAAARASPAWFLVWIVATVLGLYTLPPYLMPAAATVLLMAGISWRFRKRLRSYVALRGAVSLAVVAICTVLLYLPPVLTSGIGSVSSNEYVRGLPGTMFLDMNRIELGRYWSMLHRDLPSWMPWLGGVLACVGIARGGGGRRFRVLLCAVLATSIGFLLVFRFVPPWRTWLIYQPLYAISVSSGVVWAFRRLGAAVRWKECYFASMALLLTLLLSWFVWKGRGIVNSPGDTGLLDGAPEIVGFLLTNKISSDRVVVSDASAVPLRYYWWLRTGVHLDFREFRPATGGGGWSEVWCVVNSRRSEDLSGLVNQHDLTIRRVLETRSLHHTKLYRLEVVQEPPGQENTP